MHWTLDRALRELSCEGLLILGETAGDPDLARFLGPVHVGESFLVYRPGSTSESSGAGSAWLGYLTAMERDEAARTGLQLLDPAVLLVEDERRRHGSSAIFWRRILERAFERAGLQPTKIALAGRFPSGTAHGALSGLESAGWSFTDGRDLLLLHRKRKTASEIEETRRSAAGACAALRRCAQVLAQAETSETGVLVWEERPLTAGAVRLEISAVLSAYGLAQPRGNIVAAGGDSAVPHSEGADGRALRAGETIVVDLFPKGTLFADCTRTFCVGRPPEEVVAGHALVVDALCQAREMAVPGRPFRDLQKSTCELFAAAGVPTSSSEPGTRRGYVHGLGHGVGYEIHEYPGLAHTAGPAGILEVGDIFTLEPGIYEPDAGYGVRLEDLCLATESGIESLTPLPYDLDPRRW